MSYRLTPLTTTTSIVGVADSTTNSTDLDTGNHTDSSVVHVLMSGEHFAKVWLHVLLLLLVMVVGIPGNSLVIAVFFKSRGRGLGRKRCNSTQLLVLALAVTDLTVCTLVAPFDLYRLRHSYSIQTECACDLFEYIRNTAISLSCFLLTSMAVERYRAICSDQAALRIARRGHTAFVIAALVLCSFILTSPSVYFLGIQARVVPEQLVNTFSEEVQQAYHMFSGRTLMFTCEYLDKHDHSVGLRLFGLSSLLFFTCLIVTTIGSYSMIYLKIRQNHTSLRMALNVVAPMPTTATKGSGNAEQSKPRQSAVGIFTISSTRQDPHLDASQQQQQQQLSRNGTDQDTQQTSHSQKRQTPGSNSPVPQDEFFFNAKPGLRGPSQSTNPARRDHRNRSVSPAVSNSFMCSDEKDIDVTFDTKNDLASVRGNNASFDGVQKGSLASVLSQVLSTKDDLDLGVSDRSVTYAEQDVRQVPDRSGAESTQNAHVGDHPLAVSSAHYNTCTTARSGVPCPRPNLCRCEETRTEISNYTARGKTYRKRRGKLFNLTRVNNRTRSQCLLPTSCNGIFYVSSSDSSSFLTRKMLHGREERRDPDEARLSRKPITGDDSFDSALNRGRVLYSPPVNSEPCGEFESFTLEQLTSLKGFHSNDFGTGEQTPKTNFSTVRKTKNISNSGPGKERRTVGKSQDTQAAGNHALSHDRFTIKDTYDPLCRTAQTATSKTDLDLQTLPHNSTYHTPEPLTLSHNPHLSSGKVSAKASVDEPSSTKPASTNRTTNWNSMPSPQKSRSSSVPTATNKKISADPNAYDRQSSPRQQLRPPSSRWVKQHQDHHSARLSRQIRVAKILLMVTGAFLLCFVPFWALTLAYMFHPHFEWELDSVPLMMVSMLYQSYFVNHAINPVLFALYSPEFRQQCSVLLSVLKKRLLCGHALCHD